MKDFKQEQEEKRGIIKDLKSKIWPDSTPKGRKQGIDMPARSITLQSPIIPFSLEPTTVYVDEKLTIFFVENTNEVAKDKNKLEQIAKNLVTSGKVCIINYGSTVKVSKIVDAILFDSKNLLNQEDIGDKSCLYEALIALEKVVSKNMLKTQTLENTEWKIRKSRINIIEIIGIGRCFNNHFSEFAKEGLESFNKVASNSKVITKYFCLSEQDFIRTAALGFHSIGAINRSFK